MSERTTGEARAKLDKAIRNHVQTYYVVQQMIVAAGGKARLPEGWVGRQIGRRVIVLAGRIEQFEQVVARSAVAGQRHADRMEQELGW